MAIVRLTWSSLFFLSELDFVPEAPSVLKLTDEMIQSLSWLTGATGHDRRLLRCTEQGALLVGNAWNNLHSVETDELYPEAGTPDSYTATKENKGVLVATSTKLVKISFVRVSGGAAEDVYISAATLYFFPHTIYSVTATVVPAATGDASYVGITAFN